MKPIFFLLWIMPFLADAQTRFYTRNNANEYPIPSPHSSWNTAGGTGPTIMAYYYSILTSGTINSAQAGGTSNRRVLNQQMICPILLAQTINGTFTAQMRWRTATAGTVGQSVLRLRLINADGTVATEVGESVGTVDIVVAGTATGAMNRTFPPITITNLTVTGGQRFVIELGWNMTSGAATTTAVASKQNTGTTPDLPVDNTSLDAYNPWFEFSQKIRIATQNMLL